MHPPNGHRVGQAGGVRQQLPDRDRHWLAHDREITDVLPNCSVEIDVPLLGQLHDDTGGDDLGHREPQVPARRIDPLPRGHVGLPRAGERHDLARANHRRRHPHDTQAIDQLLQDLLKAGCGTK
jgi:hypothetical protein